MENASKAIIMAGGILISLIIISLLVMLFGGIGDAYKAQDDSKAVEQLEKYNRQFAKYNTNKGLYGSELLSLGNLVKDYNNRVLKGTEGTQFYNDNKFEIFVTYEGILPTEDDDGNNYEGLRKGTNVDILNLVNYNEKLENKLKSMKATDTGYSAVKSLLTELRSLPFQCDVGRTSTNKFGRINKMYFKQINDDNILDIVFSR